MVWHLHIGSKLRFLDPPEVLSKIWAKLVKKFKPPERPLLEVRRFFQWCQGMSLGILKRFREKKVQFFFRDFHFCSNIERLLQLWSVCGEFYRKTHTHTKLHAITQFPIFSIHNSHGKGSLCLEELPMAIRPAPHQTDTVQFHLIKKIHQICQDFIRSYSAAIKQT